MLEKPYIKKLETLDEFEVWQVDGKYIRDKVDREFTNFGQHYNFRFIPLHQFWIDKQYGNDETKYFVDHMMVEWQLMKGGMEYDDALSKADRLEKRERAKSELFQKATKEIEVEQKEIPKEIHLKKLMEFKGIEVWIVNSELVRDLYFIDYTEGGHHFVYKFVPVNEIWIDDDLKPAEMEYVLLHELHERNLMAKGMEYCPAHRSSSIIEYKCRNDPKLLKSCLQEEIEKIL